MSLSRLFASPLHLQLVRRGLGITLIAVCAATLTFTRPAAANTFTVTNTTSGAGPCIANCSLTSAINAANNNPGPDIINFNLPGAGPFSFDQIPPISDTVTINGYSQPGSAFNTLPAGTDAVFKIQFLTRVVLNSGAIDSVVKGVDFISVDGSIFASADNVGIFGNRFRGNAISYITANSPVTIGSSAVADRNHFSGPGVAINFSGASHSSIVLNNLFGRSADLGQAISSSEIIAISPGVNGIQIGGADLDQGNLFSGAQTNAIRVGTLLGIVNLGVTIRGNEFRNNIGIPINLFGPNDQSSRVTLNDIDDADEGPNGLQNYPEISSAGISGNQILLTGIMDRSATNGTRIFDIDFYASTSCHASGHGEGELFYATRQFSSNGPTDESFQFTLPLLAPGTTITSTATDFGTGQTSEFSPCVTVTGTLPPLFANGFE